MNIEISVPDFVYAEGDVHLDKLRHLILSRRSLKRYADFLGVPVVDLEAGGNPVTTHEELVALIWAFAAESDPAVEIEALRGHVNMKSVSQVSTLLTKAQANKPNRSGIRNFQHGQN